MCDAGADTGDGLGVVVFEVELAFEGVEDRLDDLAQWLEEPLPCSWLLAFAGRSEQIDPTRVEVGFEGSTVVVLDRSSSCPRW